jgi:hypothetical protein
MDFIDEQRNADMLDAMSDIAYEQEQAMRESEQMKFLMPNAMPVITTMNATSTPTVTHETIPISTT